MQIIQLDSETTSYFRNLTFPRYGHLLDEWDETRYLAFGAVIDELPVGLLLVGLTPDEEQPHQILSLYVDDEYRNQGIATTLMKALQENLSSREKSKFQGEYANDLHDLPALKRVLAKSDCWLYENYVLTLSGRIEIGMSLIPKEHAPPKGFAFLEWRKIEDSHREQMLEYARNYKSSGAHNPFYEVGVPIHEETSVVLLRGEQVLGWMLNHEIEPDVIRYSRLFVAPEWREGGLGLACIVESMRRQYQINPKSIAIFAAQSDNTPMIAVVNYFKDHPDVSVARIESFIWERSFSEK